MTPRRQWGGAKSVNGGVGPANRGNWPGQRFEGAEHESTISWGTLRWERCPATVAPGIAAPAQPATNAGEDAGVDQDMEPIDMSDYCAGGTTPPDVMDHVRRLQGLGRAQCLGCCSRDPCNSSSPRHVTALDRAVTVRTKQYEQVAPSVSPIPILPSNRPSRLTSATPRSRSNFLHSQLASPRDPVKANSAATHQRYRSCLHYTKKSPRSAKSRMPSQA